MHESKVIRLIEVTPSGSSMVRTGREIHLGDDCPLFESPKWAKAKESGFATITHDLFELLKQTIEEGLNDP